MGKRKFYIGSSTLPFSEEDFKIAKDVAKAFSVVAEEYGTFFTTVFLNKRNRKVVLKFYSGDFTHVAIDKLDMNED